VPAAAAGIISGLRLLKPMSKRILDASGASAIAGKRARTEPPSPVNPLWPAETPQQQARADAIMASALPATEKLGQLLLNRSGERFWSLLKAYPRTNLVISSDETAHALRDLLGHALPSDVPGPRFIA
jgi:hypothetical protein